MQLSTQGKLQLSLKTTKKRIWFKVSWILILQLKLDAASLNRTVQHHPHQHHQHHVHHHQQPVQRTMPPPPSSCYYNCSHTISNGFSILLHTSQTPTLYTIATTVMQFKLRDHTRILMSIRWGRRRWWNRQLNYNSSVFHHKRLSSYWKDISNRIDLNFKILTLQQPSLSKCNILFPEIEISDFMLKLLKVLLCFYSQHHCHPRWC